MSEDAKKIISALDKGLLPPLSTRHGSGRSPSWEAYNELQAQYFLKAKELERVEARLRHLLKSETVRRFDEYDQHTGTYARDIRDLDAYCASIKFPTEREKKKRSEDLARFHKEIAEAAADFNKAIAPLLKKIKHNRQIIEE